MSKLFSNIWTQFTGFFRSLPPVKRASVIGAFFAVLIAIAVTIMMATGSNYKPLLTNVASDQMVTLLSQLQKSNIPFRVQDDGKTILVPEQLLHSTQMKLMTEMGSTKIGNIGFEIFDKQDFGTTSYAQKINYQRALQGELVRAINTLTAVKQSKVILAIPPKKTFLEEGGSPTASVVIELQPGKSLTPEQVKGISYLVASGVESLDPDKVNVVDSRGKVLSRNFDTATAATGELMELKTRVEQQLEDRIESILSKVVGPGKVIARVDASLNPQDVSMVEEKVDPDATALKSSQTEEEYLDGSRTNPSGIPGSRANLPGAEDQGQVGFRQNVRKELKNSQFQVPKTIRNVKESAGNVQKISVAVLVDGRIEFAKGKDGETTEKWTERTNVELAKYENIIKSAIGFNSQRGDSVKIENIQFQKEDFTETDQLLTTLERKKLLYYFFKWSLLAAAIGLFFFIVVRPFIRWITDSFQDTVEEMLPRTIEELEELQSVDNSLPGMSAALPVLEDSIDPNKAESELLRERILSLMEADEQKAAGAFSLWLSRRET